MVWIVHTNVFSGCVGLIQEKQSEREHSHESDDCGRL